MGAAVADVLTHNAARAKATINRLAISPSFQQGTPGKCNSHAQEDNKNRLELVGRRAEVFHRAT
jgi:hypothetical protein